MNTFESSLYDLFHCFEYPAVPAYIRVSNYLLSDTNRRIRSRKDQSKFSVNVRLSGDISLKFDSLVLCSEFFNGMSIRQLNQLKEKGNIYFKSCFKQKFPEILSIKIGENLYEG